MVEYINVADLIDQNDPQGRTYREVNNATKHSYSVGQLVEISDGVRMFVAKQTRDCDGTPLYCLTPIKGDYSQDYEGLANRNWMNGICEDNMKLVND